EMTTIVASDKTHLIPGNPGVAVTRLQQQIGRPVRPLLLTLFGAVALLLVTACVNVANLFLARSTSRARELAIRIAIGSGNRRLLQQQLTESLLLVSLGGLAGSFLASLSIRVIGNILPAGSLPRWNEVRVDSHVMVFAAAVAIFAGLIFGIIPVFYARRTQVS